MPKKWLYVQLAERFPGLGGPWDVELIPASRLRPYVSLLYVEGGVQAERRGLGPDDTVDCDCYEDEED